MAVGRRDWAPLMAVRRAASGTMIPADQDADPAEAGIPGRKPQVPRGEVEFLIELRVNRDVHLPVLAEEPPSASMMAAVL